MTYILIWVIFAGGTANNVAATGTAEFNNLPACQKAASAIEAQVNSIRFVQAIATCQAKG